MPYFATPYWLAAAHNMADAPLFLQVMSLSIAAILTAKLMVS